MPPWSSSWSRVSTEQEMLLVYQSIGPHLLAHWSSSIITISSACSGWKLSFYPLPFHTLTREFNTTRRQTNGRTPQPRRKVPLMLFQAHTIGWHKDIWSHSCLVCLLKWTLLPVCAVPVLIYVAVTHVRGQAMQRQNMSPQHTSVWTRDNGWAWNYNGYGWVVNISW
jgi:hypothetical protein